MNDGYGPITCSSNSLKQNKCFTGRVRYVEPRYSSLGPGLSVHYFVDFENIDKIINIIIQIITFE